MRKLLLPIAVTGTALAGTSWTGVVPVSSASYTALSPGGITHFAETVTVNLVYVGMGNPTADVAAQLPATSAPVVRYAAFYGESADLGIRYTNTYNHVVADAAWTTALYAHLDSLAGAHQASETLSLSQEQYNQQAGNARVFMEAQNQWLSAAAVERYLADHPPTGVNTTNPTMYFSDDALDLDRARHREGSGRHPARGGWPQRPRRDTT